MTRRLVLRSSLVLAAAGIRVAGQRCERGTQPPGAAPNPLGLTASGATVLRAPEGSSSGACIEFALGLQLKSNT